MGIIDDEWGFGLRLTASVRQPILYKGRPQLYATRAPYSPHPIHPIHPIAYYDDTFANHIHLTLLFLYDVIHFWPSFGPTHGEAV